MSRTVFGLTPNISATGTLWPLILDSAESKLDWKVLGRRNPSLHLYIATACVAVKTRPTRSPPPCWQDECGWSRSAHWPQASLEILWQTVDVSIDAKYLSENKPCLFLMINLGTYALQKLMKDTPLNAAANYMASKRSLYADIRWTRADLVTKNKIDTTPISGWEPKIHRYSREPAQGQQLSDPLGNKKNKKSIGRKNASPESARKIRRIVEDWIFFEMNKIVRVVKKSNRFDNMSFEETTFFIRILFWSADLLWLGSFLAADSDWLGSKTWIGLYGSSSNSDTVFFNRLSECQPNPQFWKPKERQADLGCLGQ